MAFRVNPECIVCAYGNGLAILDSNSSEYYSIDQVGATIWSAIQNASDQGAEIDSIVAAVVKEFDVPERTARADIQTFVTALEGARLVHKVP